MKLCLEIRTRRPSSIGKGEASAGADRVDWSCRHFETDKTPVFVGRDQSMHVVLDDPLVSRQHAVIISRDERFVVQDIGGRNPLRVNGRPAVSHVLETGDVLTIGSTEIVFRGEEAEGRASVTAEDDDSEPTVVDARETLRHLRAPTRIISPDETQAIPSVYASAAEAGGRSQRNLRLLQSFGELLRNLPDREKLLDAALDTVFDSLEARRGFIGFFTPTGQLDIVAER
ncbi:MAG TPA: FHA domain-containing protein, partial [Planctomycetota bacterium]|nr:FHA domain-containing protein [Planctomycetota bacterium]